MPENHCCIYKIFFLILYWTIDWSFKTIYEILNLRCIIKYTVDSVFWKLIKLKIEKASFRIWCFSYLYIKHFKNAHLKQSLTSTLKLPYFKINSSQLLVLILLVLDPFRISYIFCLNHAFQIIKGCWGLFKGEKEPNS